MKSKSSIATGGVAVAAIVAIKLFPKTAIFASLFGGAAVAKNMYESSVMKVRDEVEAYNKKNPSEPVYMDEENKELVFNDVIPDVSSQDLVNIRKNKLDSVEDLMKKDTIEFIEKNKDSASNYFLLKHNWTETQKLKTNDDKVIMTYTVVGNEIK